MSFTFDGPNRIIQCDPGTTDFFVSAVYSAWKRWVQVSDNAKFERAFEDSIGSNSLGEGAFLGSYYFITNGWKIRPQDADHTLTIQGNLFPVPDTASIFLPTINPRNVVIEMRTSSLTQQLLVEPVNPVDESALAAAVWDADVSSVNTANYAGTILKQSGVDAAQAVIQATAALGAAQAAENAAISADATAAANAVNILAAKAAAESAEAAAFAAETAASGVAGDVQAAAIAAQAAETAALAAKAAANLAAALSA